MGEGNLNLCGLGGWRPRFMQRFTTTRWFIFVYGLLGTVQAMAFVYFIATLTTLEKRFQIPSQTTGLLMSGNEISQILLSMILAYRGGKGSRPLWIAWGVLFSSLSCFILALPHFIYGPGNNALALTMEYGDLSSFNTTLSKMSDKSKGTNPFVCSANRDEGDDEECTEEFLERSIVPLVLIFFSQFVLGIGTSLYMTLGQSYLDDNTKKKNTPKLLGVTMALRTIGPTVGFIIGFACLSLYVDPSLTPLIKRRDPRWIGAWWLGWIILGTAMTFFAFLIALFPKNLSPADKTPIEADNDHSYKEIPSVQEENSIYKAYYENEIASKKEAEESEKVALKRGVTINEMKNSEEGFLKALKRVVTNPLLMANNCTAVFYILGVSGYINFYIKYTETQFHQSAAASSVFSGVSTVLAMTVGFLASGFIISKFKPRTSYLLAWNIVIGCVYIAGQIVLMFLGCEDTTMQGNITNIGLLNPESTCNANCSCDAVSYAPVCYQAGNQTFFSACHAGCSLMENSFGERIYKNCSCLPNPTDFVKQGSCQIECSKQFITFVVVQVFIQFIGCSGRITTILVNYRSVERRDKSIAQGLALFMISLLAFIPGPIIFGRIIDATCQVWDDKCGSQGNCWLYDKDKFRIYLNSAAVGFTFGAVVLDVVVWYLGRNIKLYEENPIEKKSKS